MAREFVEPQFTGRTLIEGFQEGYAAKLRIDARTSEIGDIYTAIDAATELRQDSLGEITGILGPEVTDEQMRNYFVGKRIIRAEERRVQDIQTRLSAAAMKQAVTITPRDANNNPLTLMPPRAKSVGGRWIEESRKKPMSVAGTIDSIKLSKNLITVRPQRFNPGKNMDSAYFQTLVLDEHGFPLIDIQVRPAGFRDRKNRTLVERFAAYMYA